MTILLKKNHPLIKSLKSLKIDVKEKKKNKDEKENYLNIGIINIMPEAHEYELNLLLSLDSTEYNFNPLWIKSEIHKYKTTPPNHLEEFYLNFKNVIKNNQIDGFILTGAPVEHLNFQEITYWNELLTIFQYSKENNIPILGLCWGGLAIGEILGLKKTVFDKKVFGVFNSIYLKDNWNILLDSENFNCPQSRFAGYLDKDFEISKNIRPLAYSKEAGYFIFESLDKLLLAHIGHSEYHKERLVKESLRDLDLKREDVLECANFNIKKPVNTWKKHRKTFFTYWIKNIVLKKNKIY